MPLLLEIEDVAALVGVSKRTIYRWTTRLKFPPPVKPDGRKMWRRVDVELWVECRCNMRLWREARGGGI